MASSNARQPSEKTLVVNWKICVTVTNKVSDPVDANVDWRPDPDSRFGPELSSGVCRLPSLQPALELVQAWIQA